MALIEFRIEMSDLKNGRYLSQKKEIEQEENVGRSQQEREKQNPTFGVGKKRNLNQLNRIFVVYFICPNLIFQTKSSSENWDTIIISAFFLFLRCLSKERV